MGKVYKVLYVYIRKNKFTIYLLNLLVYLMLPEQSLMPLLESYVFNVSSKFIGRASPQNQTRLIGLLNVIGKHSSDNEEAIELPSSTVSEPFIGSPFNDLQQQWQEALTKPVVRKNSLDEYTKELVHRAIADNQRQIDATLRHMHTIGSLIARAKNMADTTPQQARLLSHYRTVQEHYVTYLAQLRLFQGRKFSLLDS